MKQIVVCAAIQSRTTGRIICGARHYDSVMRQHMAKRKFWLFGRRCRRREWKSVEQGFIDQFGQFLTRVEAWVIADRNNQIIDYSKTKFGTLFSEDLY